MTLPNGGQIAASDINYELRGWYYYQMGMYEARNGYYGGINDCSGPRPGGPSRSTNSGYAYSDWWGYQHNASCSPIYIYISDDYKKIIYMYPTPDNVDTLQYKDKTDNCFTYNLKELNRNNNTKNIYFWGRC
jgi:hypothetical protein